MTDRSTEPDTLPVPESKLAARLETVLGVEIRSLSAIALGESSRATPWRIDLRTDVGPQTVLVRLGDGCSPTEARALRAVEAHPLPAPKILHWESQDPLLGMPCFISTFVNGEPLLEAMKANAPWADALYVDTVCTVQAVSPGDLPPGAAETLDGGESALHVLESAYEMFEKPNPLAETAYRRLRRTRPELPEDRFSNGDLWPENLLVRGDRLVGIIDWQHAGFGDPIYEFLLPFFLVPELRHRGTEEAYCRRMGFDPEILHWYHGLEFFDSLRWVLRLGKPYMIHTAESLQADLARWLEETP